MSGRSRTSAAIPEMFAWLRAARSSFGRLDLPGLRVIIQLPWWPSTYSSTRFEVFVLGRQSLPFRQESRLRERRPLFVLSPRHFCALGAFRGTHGSAQGLIALARATLAGTPDRGDRPAERSLLRRLECLKIAEVHPDSFVASVGTDDDVANFRQT